MSNTDALLPRQQARTNYELGGPRLPPRGAVRAGPTPENERSNCLRLPEESSLIGQARRSPAPRVPANEPSRAIHSRQPSPHFTVFRKIVTTITSDLRIHQKSKNLRNHVQHFPQILGLRIWRNSEKFSSKSEQNSMKMIKFFCTILPKNTKTFDEILLKY